MAGGLPARLFVVVGLSLAFEFHQQFENIISCLASF